MKEINRDNLYKMTVEELPEVTEKYGKAEGLYELFGNIAIFIGEGLEKPNLDEGFVSRSFKFLNEIANNEDLEVQNIFVAGFLEVLSNYDNGIQLAQRYLKTNGAILLEKTLSEWS